MRRFTGFLLVVVGVAFAGGWPTSASGESAEEILEKIRSQFTCDGCLEFAKMRISGYGIQKEIVFRRLVSESGEDVRTDIVSRGPDYGTRYLSRLELIKSDGKRGIRVDRWEYRSENRKPRRINPGPTDDILDTGVNYPFLNLWGLLEPSQYNWERTGNTSLKGTSKNTFLPPHLQLEWERAGEAYRPTKLIFFLRSGTECRRYLFKHYEEISGAHRAAKVEVIFPSGDISTIAFSNWYFLEQSPEMEKIFYQETLREEVVQEPEDSHILAKIDFLNKSSP